MADRQVTVSEPWGPVGERLAGPGGVFDVGQQLYGQMPGYFPHQTTIGFNPYQELGMGLTAQRALAGSPYEQALQHYLGSTLGQGQVNLGGSAQTAQQLQGGLGAGQQSLMGMAGGGTNPYLDQMFGAASRGLTRQFQESVLPGVAAQMGAAGRTGSGAHQAALATAQGELATGLGDLASNIYGGAYESDATRRLQAAQALQTGAMGGLGAMSDIYGNIGQQQARAAALAPAAQQMEYANLGQLMGVGGAVNQQAQQQLQAEMDRYNYYQGLPYQQLSGYHQMLAGPYGGGMQTTTGGPSGPGRFQSALGGAATGAAIGSAIPGIGTALGAGIGGLGGLIFGG